jgi:hypothetical protein
VLLTISGSSCSGKTSIARACADVSGLVVHDFDEIGVPGTANVSWRQRSLEEWIQRALGYQDEGLDVLLTGQSPLGEVLASPSATRLHGIAACLLDVDDRERGHRLNRRDPGKWNHDAIRSFVGWARWHREHAADPQHRPEVITTGGWQEMRWSRWTGWTRGDRRWSVTVLDTSGRTLARSAADLRRWIASVRSASAVGELALAGEWAST